MNMQLIVSSQITDDQNLVRPCLKQYYVHVYTCILLVYFPPVNRIPSCSFNLFSGSKRNLSENKYRTIYSNDRDQIKWSSL